ncbi:MAG TPA: COX15/CtaA family protein [Verrucomicrobiae bacterium]|nr:COX15/CtaA family protein [Verrucomicrobiae bacterium]
MSASNRPNPWLHRFAVLTAVATLILIGVGGLVTSKGAGMAVPDWPTSYGYNMFALPIKFWTGGALYEHTHRLWASMVGLLVVALTRWLGGPRSRLLLAIIGATEMLVGMALPLIKPELKGTGYFLTGIAGVVLLAALVWVKHQPASRALVRLGWTAFVLVQVQGLLGGLRVVLFQDQLGIFHAALAQIFFTIICVIALFTGRNWKKFQIPKFPGLPSLRRAVLGTTILIFIQLLLGATMRHQHAGLSISDFPLAHGQLWPATDPDSILRYNQERVEISALNPITAFQVQLQMVHRLVAVLILFAVAMSAWLAVRKIGLRHSFSKLSLGWLGLILLQVVLGAATVLSHKAADIATAHVLVGVLSLVTGTALCIFTSRSLESLSRASSNSELAPDRTSLAADLAS